MDESNKPEPQINLLGREDREGLKLYKERPQGVFDKLFMDQRPEANMPDLHEIGKALDAKNEQMKKVRLSNAEGVKLKPVPSNSVDGNGNPLSDNVMMVDADLTIKEENRKLDEVAEAAASEDLKALQAHAEKNAAKKAEWKAQDEKFDKAAESRFKDAVHEQYILKNPYPHANDWWRSVNLDIRIEWADMAKAGLLCESGLPLPMAQMVEGKINTIELEMVNYCKLAGLRYKTGKEQLERQAKGLRDLCEKLIGKIDKLVDDFKKLQTEE